MVKLINLPGRQWWRFGEPSQNLDNTFVLDDWFPLGISEKQKRGLSPFFPD
ncbi:hypothetical protein MICAB_1240004 [Microcystis aeruginosa PCC 9717]|uniref:Uncharacterized protein n=1 Tax=Microcystis aeruginosa PCC 9717 TaxID=1160286 RepID=I4FJU9_MICAE|nr:hypothetical protein MICAB_1240004 [Microcystis aeruginosa PCC 9717]